MQIQAVVHLQHTLNTPQMSEVGHHPTCSTTKHRKHLTSETGDRHHPTAHHTAGLCWPLVSHKSHFTSPFFVSLPLILEIALSTQMFHYYFLHFFFIHCQKLSPNRAISHELVLTTLQRTKAVWISMPYTGWEHSSSDDIRTSTGPPQW